MCYVGTSIIYLHDVYIDGKPVIMPKKEPFYDVSLFAKALNRFNESLRLENNDYKVCNI